MALVSQAIARLLGGVSQRPQAQRDASECSEQINLIADIGTGLRTRPPTVLSATLSASPTSAFDSVHEHDVLRSADDRYRIILSDGDLKVFDVETGVEETVTFPDGKTYLDTTDPAGDFRCVTVGDVTYIVNRSVITAKGTAVSQTARNEALVSIRQADFGTKYSVTLDDTTISHTTVEGFSPSDRVSIATEVIAETLQELMQAESGMSGFSVTRYGSTLYIKKLDGTDFTISASDGLADEGIRAIKGSVQRFDDLPERAKNGFVVQITGDPTNQFDNYFVKYDDNGLPNLAGVWKETVKPGTLIEMNNSSMPHQLVRGANLVDGVEAGSLPASALVGYGEDTTLTDGWESLDNVLDDTHTALTDPATYYGLGDAILGTTTGYAISSALGDLDGSRATIRINYDISTSKMGSGNSILLQLWVSNAPSATPIDAADYTFVSEKLYGPGITQLRNQSIELIDELPANTRIQLRVRYAADPNVQERAAVIILHPNFDSGGGGAGIEVIKASGRTVTFDPIVEYPEGCDITVTVDATGYTYTTVEGDTGTEVATALAALIAGGFTGTTPEDGLLLIAGATLPDVSVTVAFDAATTFYSPDLVLTADALVGAVIQNLTDGSSGTITSNTVNTITVAALTGGGTNRFNRGDLCSVEGADTDAFVFQEVLWKKRLVGDAVTIPWPSFIGKPLDEIFFDRNRLGLVSKGRVILSQPGAYTNLFRQSATKLLADDPIDVQAVSASVSNFHSVVHLDGKALLWSSRGQSVLDGQPNLTPETISITPKTSFANTTRMRPVVAGSKLFFAHAHGDCTRVFEYSIVNETGTMDADDITEHVPTYIAGAPIAMVADSSLGFLAVLTDDDQSKLYVCNYAYRSQTRVQNAWSKWDFGAGATIVAMGMVDSTLSLVVKRSTGVYLETVDLDPANAGATGNDAGGSPFNWSYTFSTIFKRSVNRDGRTEVDTRGRLTIRRMMVQTHDTDGMTATVTLQGRAPIDYTFDGSTDEFRFPVLGRNTYATIELSGTSADAVFIDSVDWEANFDARSARV